MTEKLLRVLNYPFLIVACLFPVVIRILFPGIRHGYDISKFIEVGKYSETLRGVYSGEPFANYPFLGVLSSSGLLKFFDYNVNSYLLTLSLVEVCNVLLIFFILRSLQVFYSGFWAALIALLPSTWAGASLWGQIDHVGQCVLLLLTLLLCYYYMNKQLSKKLISFVILSGLLLSVGFLTKQVLIFSIFCFGLFTFLTILKTTKTNHKPLTKYIVLRALAILTPILLIDQFLTLPAEYNISHFQTVYLKGSEHINKISGNGFNIWTLFYTDFLIDSTAPLIGSLSPKIIGIIIFSIASILLTVNFVRLFNASSLDQPKQSLISFLLYLALINLSFNVLLTGTHDRYLYHFYPFILIAIIASHQSIKSVLKHPDSYIIITGAILYGLFILSILMMVQQYFSNTLLAVFHLLLFLYLFYKFYTTKNLFQS